MSFKVVETCYRPESFLALSIDAVGNLFYQLCIIIMSDRSQIHCLLFPTHLNPHSNPPPMPSPSLSVSPLYSGEGGTSFCFLAELVTQFVSLRQGSWLVWPSLKWICPLCPSLTSLCCMTVMSSWLSCKCIFSQILALFIHATLHAWWAASYSVAKFRIFPIHNL